MRAVVNVNQETHMTGYRARQGWLRYCTVPSALWMEDNAPSDDGSREPGQALSPQIITCLSTIGGSFDLLLLNST